MKEEGAKPFPASIPAPPVLPRGSRSRSGGGRVPRECHALVMASDPPALTAFLPAGRNNSGVTGAAAGQAEGLRCPPGTSGSPRVARPVWVPSWGSGWVQGPRGSSGAPRGWGGAPQGPGAWHGDKATGLGVPRCHQEQPQSPEHLTGMALSPCVTRLWGPGGCQGPLGVTPTRA